MAKRLKKARKKRALLKRRDHTGKAPEKIHAREPRDDVAAEEEIGRALTNFSAETENVW
jgi:hypothetical protein